MVPLYFDTTVSNFVHSKWYSWLAIRVVIIPTVLDFMDVFVFWCVLLQLYCKVAHQVNLGSVCGEYQGGTYIIMWCLINYEHFCLSCHKLHIRIYMWLGLRKSTMWAQFTPSYIFVNIFHSKCSIPILLAAEESPLNTSVVIKILLQ